MNIFTTLDSETENTKDRFFNKKGVFEVSTDLNEKNILWFYVAKYFDNIFSLTYTFKIIK